MKNDDAKKIVINKLKSAFGKDYIGENNKKYYVWVGEGNDRCQVALALTVPKIMVEKVNVGDYDFENMDKGDVAPTTYEPAEITQEEKDTIEALAAMLGL